MVLKKKIIFELKKVLKDNEEKNLILNILAAFLIKGLSLFITFFSMPLYIKYFDNNRVLGVWYTILSVLSWIVICDLGFGNGLRNKFTEAYAKEEFIKAKKYVSSTYVFLSFIVFPIIIFGSFLILCSNLNNFFNISIDVINSRSLKTGVLILFFGICINFVLKSINSIVYAIQKSSLNNFVSLIISLIPLLFILISSNKGINSNFVSLAFVHALAINIPLIILSLAIFRSKKLKLCKPELKYFEFSTAKQMLNIGLQFFIVQIFFMILMSTNEIFIIKFFSVEDIVEYNIYYRLFMVVGSLFMLALTPLWSKITKDLAEKKYYKIKVTNRILYIISTVAMFSEFLIIPFIQVIINIWLRERAIKVDYTTTVIFALYGGLYILNIVLTTVANGMGKLKTQIFFYGLGAIFKYLGIVLLKKIILRWDIVILYNCFILIMFCIFQIFWIKKEISKLEKV